MDYFDELQEKLKNRHFIVKMFSWLKYKIIMVYDFFRYDLKRGIRNLWVWFPVIWKQFDFDQAYLYRLISHKLKLMRKVL